MATGKEWKFNWSNFGVALGVFAGTAALGLLGITLAKGKKHQASFTKRDVIPTFIPAAGAGTAAYFLRKRCPACVQSNASRAEGTIRTQDILI